MKLTRIRHASGLALWIVRWVTLALDGEVAFDDRDPPGVDTLRLPGVGPE